MGDSSDFADVPSDGVLSSPQSPRRPPQQQRRGLVNHDEVALQGWLKKAPYGNLSMFGMLMLKKRYFVLSNDDLWYYHADEDFMLHAEPLGKIKIEAFSTLTNVDGIDQWGMQLKIAGKENAVYLQAATKETRTLWAEKLRAVIAKNNRKANIVHQGFLVQRTVRVSGLKKVQRKYYFVVLKDHITCLNDHFDNPKAVSKGSIFFTPGSTVRKTGPTDFTFTGADGESIDVVAPSKQECEQWISILIHTIEQFSQNITSGGATGERDDSTDEESGGGRASNDSVNSADGGGVSPAAGGGPVELTIDPNPTGLGKFQAAVRKVASRRHSFKVRSNEYRLWVGTWNMGNADPFKGLSAAELEPLLCDLVPKDHDIYVLGVQECVSSSTFAAVEEYLRHASSPDSSVSDSNTWTSPIMQVPLGVEGVDPLAKDADSVSALDLQVCHPTSPAEGSRKSNLKNVKSKTGARRRHSTLGTASPIKGSKSRRPNLASNNPADNFPQLFRLAKEAAENRPDRIYGRGDGAILFPKFTGIALFMRASVFPHARVTSVAKCELTSGPLKSSKGAAAFVLQLHNYTSLCFISCHLEANKPRLRRQQFKTCVRSLGSALYPLARSNHDAHDKDVRFELTSMFHHTMWMGDLNYRTVGLSGRQVQHLIKKNRTSEMHARADGLLRDQQEFDLWHGFYEPPKAEDFFPTYKKHEMPDPPINFSDPDWPDRCYRTLYKEPQYKGGKWKERVPGWCDRIMLRHMRPGDREIGGNQFSTIAPVMHYNPRPRDSNAATPTQSDTVAEDQSFDRSVWTSSYTSVNSGQAMTVSDHSPVRCSYNLSLHGFNETAAKKIELLLSNIVLVEEGGGSGYRECPLFVRLMFPAPYEEVANQASVDVLKRQDSRYTSTEDVDGMSIGCSYHHRKPLSMLHALVTVRTKAGATGQAVFSMDDMLLDPKNPEAEYEVEVFRKGVPLRMGWEEDCDPKDKKKSKTSQSDESATSDEDEALFADCANGAAAAPASHSKADSTAGKASTLSPTQSPSVSRAAGDAEEAKVPDEGPPPMKPIVFNPIVPAPAILQPQILLRFRCRLAQLPERSQ